MDESSDRYVPFKLPGAAARGTHFTCEPSGPANATVTRGATHSLKVRFAAARVPANAESGKQTLLPPPSSTHATHRASPSHAAQHEMRVELAMPLGYVGERVDRAASVPGNAPLHDPDERPSRTCVTCSTAVVTMVVLESGWVTEKVGGGVRRFTTASVARSS